MKTVILLLINDAILCAVFVVYHGIISTKIDAIEATAHNKVDALRQWATNEIARVREKFQPKP